jgi:hypothetical protein
MEEQLRNNFKNIYDNYNNIIKQLNNIAHDIQKLEGVHKLYISDSQIDNVNYSIYIDDIKHQINIINSEYNYLNNVNNMNLNKFYRDLFKLYTKIVKILLNIYKENKDVIIKIWNSNEKIINETNEFKKFKKIIKYISDTTRSSNIIMPDNKIIEEIKRKYYTGIKIFNELEIQTFDLSDIETLYNELETRLHDLSLSCELIKINLNDIKIKTDKGILGQTLIMDLTGKIEKIKVDYNIMLKLCESVLNIHNSLSRKYKDLTIKIANEVAYDEETSDKLTDKLTSNNLSDGKISNKVLNNKMLTDTNNTKINEGNTEESDDIIIENKFD